MADIKMCHNFGCPIADACHRSCKSGTIPDPIQTYVRREYELIEDGKDEKGKTKYRTECDYFWRK